MRGFWDATGAWHDDRATLTLSCDAKTNAPDVEQHEETDGAITKCLRDWQLEPGTPGDPFLACIRMVRADYCGDGRTHTFIGTEVAVATPRDPPTIADCADGRCFEASWSKDGAVCIARARWQGDGMGFDDCRVPFVPTGGLSCRGNPDAAVVFSRSKRRVCNVRGTMACGPETEPVCTAK